MPINCGYLPYKDTGYFSKIIIDYLDQAEAILPFQAHPPTWEGLQQAIRERKQHPGHRTLLVTELKKQYEGLPLSELQTQHLEKLLDDNTFTVCTAHQPNIFTGHLYFIYKILHTIKLAERLSREMPGSHFVPVYYMGSEDADLEELGHINLNGEKLEWKTRQTGAVGRMKVDKQLIELITRIQGELGVMPFGGELITLLKESYIVGRTIQQSTLELVNRLFGAFGLLVLIPDNANLKRPFNEVVKKELTEQFSHPLVEKTGAELGRHYKVQASGREINLFYLAENERIRITKEGDLYKIPGKEWATEDILREVDANPERFSANVILRGVFQEMILPNIAFIGGGGEIAYWLELKEVFKACNIPFPVLLVRNSFLIIEEKDRQAVSKLGFKVDDFFKPEVKLVKELVAKKSGLQLQLDREKLDIKSYYEHLKDVAGAVDVTLGDHVSSLQAKTQKTIEALEKKMMRSEKKKFESSQRQISHIKSRLFPGNNLQERVDNFSPYYAKHGAGLFNVLLETSGTVEQQFGILEME